MTSPLDDVRHAARTLLRARAFTAVCVTSLGLGMGVVIAVLTFINGVLGPPPGVAEDRLAEPVVRPSGHLRAQASAAMIDTWSWPDYLDVREAPGMTITGWSPGEGLVQPPEGGAAVEVPTMYTSSNYFSTIGVPLAFGRGFTPGTTPRRRRRRR